MERRNIKILAIDDNQDNLTSLKALIKDSFPEAVTLTALNGTKGFELAAAEDPDVILLDVVMPGMDGFEVCKKLKADKKLSDIPVVFVTAVKGDPESRIRALECGGDAFLAKPIDKSELTAQIRAMVRIKIAGIEKRDENQRLLALVEEQTRELKNAHAAALNLLEDVSKENQARKQSEKALKESEQKLRSIAEQSSDLIALTDVNGRITYASGACMAIFHCEPDEMCNRHFMEFLYEPDIPKAIAAFGDSIEHGKSVKNLVLTMKRNDGSLFTGELNGAKFQHDLMNGTLVFIHDITERKQAEEKIREKDVQFRKLSSNLPDLIYQFTRRPDGTYCVPIASEGIKNIFGCAPEDVQEDFAPIARVIFPEDAERVISDIEYSAKYLTYFTCEFRVQIPGKPIQWIFSRSTPEKLADGSITWYGFNANITEIKQTEFELTRAKERAEESDRLKSAFLANMSHEIRTPMNGILGFAQLLREPDHTGKEQQEFIRIIEKSGKRMLNIINDIVDISKIESGQMVISISETNINEQIEFIYDFFAPEVEKNGLQLDYKTTLPPNQSLINTDREKVYAILINLVNNAIKYTSTGSIEFGYEKKGKYLEFYVKDTGIGIREHYKEIIFKRFRQGDDLTKKFTEGTGLGLSIAKGYVELLGGKIWLESKLGKGSTFYFTIPYNAALESKRGSTKIPSEITPEHHVKNLKILIAEDDQASLSFLSRVLKLFCREILTAGTGVEAVETCRNNPDLDLILMDITMPELNGYEATQQIRGFNKDVIIIAQTAYAMADDREKALEAGCNDYISKPIRTDALKELIQMYFK